MMRQRRRGHLTSGRKRCTVRFTSIIIRCGLLGLGLFACLVFYANYSLLLNGQEVESVIETYTRSRRTTKLVHEVIELRQEIKQQRSQNSQRLSALEKRVTETEKEADEAIVKQQKEIRAKPSWGSSFAFGIPTIARPGNPDYLLQTITSLQHHGVPVNQIYILHGRNESHAALEDCLKTELIKSFHLVPRDPAPISIDYNISKTVPGRLKEAYGDDPERKRWRIQEAHDFMWLTQYMLNNTDAPYIVFNQDDAVMLEDLHEVILQHFEGENGSDKRGSIISQYGPTGKAAKKKTQQRVCHVTTFCGMVSMIFRRDVLQHMLTFLQPIWKQQPIDWALEEFIDAFHYTIPVFDNVKHIGVKSSLEGKEWGKEGPKRKAGGKKSPKQKPGESHLNELQTAAISRIARQSQVECQQLPPQPVVFGIFSLQDSPKIDTRAILDGALESMKKMCLRTSQIYIADNRPKFKPMLGELALKSTISLVSGAPLVSSDYQVTRRTNARVIEAFRDTTDQKQRRITLAHNFMWTAQYLLNNTDVPYIGFNQDDVYWTSALPNLTDALTTFPIISLYSKNTIRSGTVPTCFKTYSCFFASYVFRRDVLQDFLDWMQPLFKEGPLDWTLEDYVTNKTISIPVFPRTKKVTNN